MLSAPPIPILGFSRLTNSLLTYLLTYDYDCYDYELQHRVRVQRKQWLCFRPRQQVKIALHCRNIFADSLLTEPLELYPVRMCHICQ